MDQLACTNKAARLVRLDYSTKCSSPIRCCISGGIEYRLRVSFIVNGDLGTCHQILAKQSTNILHMKHWWRTVLYMSGTIYRIQTRLDVI